MVMRQKEQRIHGLASRRAIFGFSASTTLRHVQNSENGNVLSNTSVYSAQAREVTIFPNKRKFGAYYLL